MVGLTLIFAVLLGIWTPVFNTLLKKGIHDSIVLNGPVRTHFRCYLRNFQSRKLTRGVTLFPRTKSGEAWQYWTSTTFKDSPIIYESYAMYNCTNVAEVLQGHMPIIDVRNFWPVRSSHFEPSPSCWQRAKPLY